MSIHIPVPAPELIPIVDKFTAPELLTRGRKPVGPVEIDWNNPSTEGLYAHWLVTLNDSGGGNNGGAIYDTTGINPPGNVGSGATAEVKIFEGRIVMSTAIINSGFIMNTNQPAQAVSTGGHTWVIRVRIQSGNNIDDTIFGNRDEGTASPLQFIKLTPGGFEYFNASNEGISYSLPIESWHTIIVTKIGDTLRYYDDGIEVGTSTVTKTMDINPVYIGAGNAAGTNEEIAGEIEFAMLFNIGLSASKVVALTADPHQFLKTAIPLFFPAPELEFLPLTNRIVPTRKPAGRYVIDWTHPLTDGLVKAFFFIGGDLRDYVNNDNPIVNGTAFSNRGLEQTGTEVISWTSDRFDGGFGSIVFDFQGDGNTPATLAKFAITVDTEWQIRRFTDDISLQLNINNVQAAFDTPDLWDQALHKFSLVWNAADNFRRVTVDKTTNTSSTAFTAPTISADFHLLNRADGLRDAAGRMTYCLVYANRNLSRAEEDSFHENPYQFLKPATPAQIPYEPNKALDGFWLSDPRFEMPSLQLPYRTPKSHQVEIDFNHPFADKLNNCFIWDSFRPHDIAGNVPDAAVTIGGSAWKIDQGFLKLDRSASNEITIADANERFELTVDVNASWAFLHVFRFDPDAPVDANEFFLHHTNFGGTGAFINGDLDNFGMTLYDGQVHCVILTAKLDTNAVLDLWLDGVFLGTDTVTSSEGSGSAISYQSDTNVIETSAGDGANTNLFIGGVSIASGDRWQGHLMAFMGWKRYLTHGEARSLSINPYQILIPA